MAKSIIARLNIGREQIEAIVHEACILSHDLPERPDEEVVNNTTNRILDLLVYADEKKHMECTAAWCYTHDTDNCTTDCPELDQDEADCDCSKCKPESI